MDSGYLATLVCLRLEDMFHHTPITLLWKEQFHLSSFKYQVILISSREKIVIWIGYLVRKKGIVEIGWTDDCCVALCLMALMSRLSASRDVVHSPPEAW